jgi:hypothetical protein
MVIAEAVFLHSFSDALGYHEKPTNISWLENYTSLHMLLSLRMCGDSPAYNIKEGSSLEQL